MFNLMPLKRGQRLTEDNEEEKSDYPPFRKRERGPGKKPPRPAGAL
jgi:hypothetical protein